MKQMVFKTIFVLAMAMVSLQANAQVKEFEKYADTKNITYVYISKLMLQMAGKKAAFSIPGVELNINNITNKLTGIQIITSEEKHTAARLRAETLSFLKNGKYDQLMQVNEDNEKVRIYHHEGKKQSVIVMLNEEAFETSVIVFSGSFSLKDMMSLTQ